MFFQMSESLAEQLLKKYTVTSKDGEKKATKAALTKALEEILSGSAGEGKAKPKSKAGEKTKASKATKGDGEKKTPASDEKEDKKVIDGKTVVFMSVPNGSKGKPPSVAVGIKEGKKLVPLSLSDKKALSKASKNVLTKEMVDGLKGKKGKDDLYAKLKALVGGKSKKEEPEEEEDDDEEEDSDEDDDEEDDDEEDEDDDDDDDE